MSYSNLRLFIMIFKRVILPLLVLGLLVAGYFYLALRWSYSNGDRAGWIQKLSEKVFVHRAR
jgi:hypothetical protein